jgi:hypothetical protein
VYTSYRRSDKIDRNLAAGAMASSIHDISKYGLCMICGDKRGVLSNSLHRVLLMDYSLEIVWKSVQVVE